MSTQASRRGTSTPAKTVLHSAVRAGDEQTVRLILEKDCRIAKRRYRAAFRSIESKTPNGEPQASGGARRRGHGGQTPLHIACMTGRSSIVSLLLANGDQASHRKSLEGNCALHLAVMHGHAETVSVLLRAPGVGLNARNALGLTPLHLAVCCLSEPIVRELLRMPGIEADTLTNLRCKSGREIKKRLGGNVTAFEISTRIPYGEVIARMLRTHVEARATPVQV